MLPRSLEPLRIDLIENRFEYLSGKALLKEEKVLQHYRHIPMKADANQMLTGLGTGQGTWGTSNLLLTKLTTVPTPAPKRRDAPVLPANLETFVKAIELLAEQRSCEVRLIGLGRGDSSFGPHTLASVPTHDPQTIEIRSSLARYRRALRKRFFLAAVPTSVKFTSSSATRWPDAAIRNVS
jgi:hypothetical protein